MMVVTCREKTRDRSGRITHYTLQDQQGNVLKVTAEQLKEKIFEGLIRIDNLKLTSDGRLIDAKTDDNEHEVVGKDYPAGAKLFVQSMVDLLWNRKIYTKTYTNGVRIPESGIEIPTVMVLTLINGDIATGNEMRIGEAALISGGSFIQTTLSERFRTELNAKDKIIKLGIGATLTLKKDFKEGSNILPDFTVYIGVLEEVNYVNTLNCNYPILQDIATYINNELDGAEIVASTIFSNESDLKKAVNTCAMSCVASIEKCLGLDKPVNVIGAALGEAVGSALGAVGVGKVIKESNPTLQQNTYKTHMEQLKDNRDKATEAKKRIDAAQTQKETIQKKGLFGGFKR